MSRRLTAYNLTRDVALTERAQVADTFLTRLVGLLRHREIDSGGGLWIMSCNSIHSVGMKFNFDAVFLDRDLRVVHLMGDMKPWRASRIVWAAKSVLEIPSGTILKTFTRLGDQFEMRLDPVPGVA